MGSESDLTGVFPRAAQPVREQVGRLVDSCAQPKAREFVEQSPLVDHVADSCGGYVCHPELLEVSLQFRLHHERRDYLDGLDGEFPGFVPDQIPERVHSRDPRGALSVPFPCEQLQRPLEPAM